MEPSLLDEPGIYDRRDPSAMRQRLRGLGEQCREAWRQVETIGLPDSYGRVRTVVLAGMGGSAVGGDLMADLAAALGVRLPICTWRDYGLPLWVDRSTLVIASSYSGETEETLSAFHAALERGVPVVALTSGGTLKNLAQTNSVPIIHIACETEPRLALGYSFVAPVALLVLLGLFPNMHSEVQKAAEMLDTVGRSWSERTPQEKNRAKVLASQVAGHLPVVYGGGLLAGAARRWKTDINENAKSWAAAEILPEASHNAVTGYAMPDSVRKNAFVIFLRSSLLPPRIRLRYQVIAELLDRADVGYTFVDAQGSEPLDHILSTVCLGAWVSYYLAMLYGVDPSRVPGIDRLKQRLGELRAP